MWGGVIVALVLAVLVALFLASWYRP